MVALDQAAHRNRAQVGDLEGVISLERHGGARLDCDRKPWRAIDQAQKGGLDCAREAARSRTGKERIRFGFGLSEDDQFAADHIGARAAVALERAQRLSVGASLGRAIDAARGIAETRSRAEVKPWCHYSAASRNGRG